MFFSTNTIIKSMFVMAATVVLFGAQLGMALTCEYPKRSPELAKDSYPINEVGRYQLLRSQYMYDVKRYLSKCNPTKDQSARAWLEAQIVLSRSLRQERQTKKLEQINESPAQGEDGDSQEIKI